MIATDASQIETVVETAIQTLIESAESAAKPVDAMNLSQAACNAANAYRTLRETQSRFPLPVDT